jgi:hypothetical protein
MAKEWTLNDTITCPVKDKMLVKTEEQHNHLSR